jgi:hypothetical protein
MRSPVSARTPSTFATSGCRPHQTKRSSTERHARTVSSSRLTPDFGTLLAARKQTEPSVILFRHGSQHRPTGQTALLSANLPQPEQALEVGGIVVITPDRISVRALPLLP